MNPSESKAAKLKELFAAVELPEIPDVDFRTLTPEQIAQLLPPYGGAHPIKAILVDRATGKGYGIASGYEPNMIIHNGIQFISGALSLETAGQASENFKRLRNHAEAIAAAFMRKMHITDATAHINGRNPCWGEASALGCYYHLPELLAEGSKMIVYNKYGADFLKAWPDRLFHFEGLSD
jgi:hypothetical protein